MGNYPYQDTWGNGYYDRQQGFASEYLMTGDPRWFDRLEATVRHIIGVNICHASVELALFLAIRTVLCVGSGFLNEATKDN